MAAFALLLDYKVLITIQTDKGSKLLNIVLQKLLREYGVHHFATHNEEMRFSTESAMINIVHDVIVSNMLT